MRPNSMRVRVVSFGPWKAVFADGGEWRTIDDGATVGDLLGGLAVLTKEALGSAAVAVNQEYVRRDAVLREGDEVAILPPVSGGSFSDGEETTLVALTRAEIATSFVMGRVKAGGDGAVCVFDGIVRDNTRGRQTLHLEYEAYEGMALKQMRLLRVEAMQLFGVREVAIVHRLGRLVVGETSILIVVSSAHRGAAFDACEWVIDTLKKTVPIWKKEHFVDGAVWADGEPFPEAIVGGA